jgi:hypothetical protein
MRRLPEFVALAATLAMFAGGAYRLAQPTGGSTTPPPPPPAPPACKIGDLVRVEYENEATDEEARKRDPQAPVYLTTVSFWAYGTLTQAGADFVTISGGYYRWKDGGTWDVRHLTISRKAVRSVVTLKPDQTVSLPAMPPVSTTPAPATVRP